MLGAMAIIFVAFLAPSGTVVIANFQNEYDPASEPLHIYVK